MPACGSPYRLVHTCALGANPQFIPPRGLGKNVLLFARPCPQRGRKLDCDLSTPGLTPQLSHSLLCSLG